MKLRADLQLCGIRVRKLRKRNFFFCFFLLRAKVKFETISMKEKNYFKNK